MNKSTPPFRAILEQLTHQARVHGFNDTEWAARAGIRKETLSRLRGRVSCDFGTLHALAAAVGANIGIIDPHSGLEQSLFPLDVGRAYEERLVDLCASRDLNPERWRQSGPRFFMAGLAVMMASVPPFDRRALLALAENLHAGSSRVEVFAFWLEHSPIHASRFVPMVLASQRRAA